MAMIVRQLIRIHDTVTVVSHGSLIWGNLIGNTAIKVNELII